MRVRGIFPNFETGTNCFVFNSFCLKTFFSALFHKNAWRGEQFAADAADL